MPDRVRAFLQLAQEELASARLLADRQPRQSAYFCQQCAEKLARAVLDAAGIPWGTGHNLGQMAAALPADHPWRERIRALDKHSPAATRYRYPTSSGRIAEPPGAERVREDLDELTGLLDLARSELLRP